MSLTENNCIHVLSIHQQKWDKNPAISFLAALADINRRGSDSVSWWVALEKPSYLGPRQRKFLLGSRKSQGRVLNVTSRSEHNNPGWWGQRWKAIPWTKVLGQVFCSLLGWLLHRPPFWIPRVEMPSEAGRQAAETCGGAGRGAWKVHALLTDAQFTVVFWVLFKMLGCPSRTQLQGTGYIWVKGLHLMISEWTKGLVHFRKFSKSTSSFKGDFDKWAAMNSAIFWRMF